MFHVNTNMLLSTAHGNAGAPKPEDLLKAALKPASVSPAAVQQQVSGMDTRRS